MNLNRWSQVAIIFILAVIAVAVIPGCAAPQSFNERLLAGYSTVAETRTTASTLLNARKIGSQDAENIQQQADLARQGLDIAKNLRSTEPQTAEQKLSSVHTIIQALKAYLLAKEAK